MAVAWCIVPCVVLAAPTAELPRENSERRLLDLPSHLAEKDRIAFAHLPQLSGERAIISRADPVLKFQLHSYLGFHDGLYWCMWSQGRPVEDEPGQEVRYATSRDGLQWSEARRLTGAPPAGHGYVARGFWIRDGKLLALAARFNGKGAFGADKDLQLLGFEWEPGSQLWRPKGIVYENAANNFAPERLPTGDWMMTRRDKLMNVHVLIGGQQSLRDWRTYEVVGRREINGFSPDEPIWWNQPDGTQVMLFRDNGGSSRLYQATSGDNGRNWSQPERTNFPSSPSKIFSLAVKDRCRVLISNANPAAARRRLHLAASADGVTFRRLAQLQIAWIGLSSIQYPHAIVHADHLLVTYSRNKAIIEAFRIPLGQVEAMCE